MKVSIVGGRKMRNIVTFKTRKPVCVYPGVYERFGGKKKRRRKKKNHSGILASF